MFWGKTKHIISEEYEDLLVKIKPLITEIHVLKSKNEQLETQLNSLRGLINRKARTNKINEDDDDNDEDGKVVLSKEEAEGLRETLKAMGYEQR